MEETYLEPGTVLNNIYRVIKLIGKGAMGRVYLVERTKDDKRFVVKELVFTQVSGLDLSTAREIFFREAEFMANFSHPGLPGTYGVFTQNDRDYLVMDYIEGKTLEEIINESGKFLPEDRSIMLFIELCDIMDYLHNSFKSPVVYRDLKPSNIIITPAGRVKLVDFGISRYYNPDKDTDTFSYGSPGYAAPEQYKGKGQSTVQSDVFGLGVILFQLLTSYDPSVKPFYFPSLKSLNPSISGELGNIVKRAIELDPMKRYISVMEFKENIEKYMGIKKPEKTAHSKFSLLAVIIASLICLFSCNLFFGFGYDHFMALLPCATFIFLCFSLYIVLRCLIFYKIRGREYKLNYFNNLACLMIFFTISMFFSELYRGFMNARTDGIHSACLSNLKNIGTAIIEYKEKEITYPASLSYLTAGHYMKFLPICPHGRANYGYSFNNSTGHFTLWCGKANSHRNYLFYEYKYMRKDECWPQYSSETGIINTPEDYEKAKSIEGKK